MLIASLFILLSLLSIALYYIGTGKHKGLLVLLILWFVYVALVSYSGLLIDTQARPSRFMLMMIPVIALSIVAYKLSAGKKLQESSLIAIHTLRIPVEIGLYRLFLWGKIPQLMTFEGVNFDIVFGLSAIVVLVFRFLSSSPLPLKLFRIWNYIGLIFLSIIVTVAILSSPLPIQLLAFEQPNVAVLIFPFTYLPALIVPLVLLAHIHLLGIKDSVQ